MTFFLLAKALNDQTKSKKFTHLFLAFLQSLSKVVRHVIHIFIGEHTALACSSQTFGELGFQLFDLALHGDQTVWISHL